MTKAASSNARRSSGGIREMAEEAARRQRMSLGDWLNAVVADEAAASGVAVRDVSLEDRQTAIITRLRDMVPPAASSPVQQKVEAPDAAPRAESDARRAEPAIAAQDRAPREEPKAERNRERRRDRASEGNPSRSWPRDAQSPGRKRGGSGGDGGHGRRDSDPERSDRRRGDAVEQRARAVDFEVSVEDMLAGIERRVARTQRQADVALASMSELLDTTADQRAAFAAMAARLAEVEEQVVARGGEDMKPIKGALARVEARLDTLTRRGEPLEPALLAEELAAGNRVAKSLLAANSPRDDDGSAMAPATPAALARLEAKLNSILDAVQPGQADPAPQAGERPSQRPLRDAIDEIARRQKALDAVPPPLGRARVVRPARDFDRNLPMSAAMPGLAHLGRDVQTLLAKVDDVRRDVAGRAMVQQQADAQARSFQDLRSDVAGLATALGDLAPRRSMMAVETAIAGLNERMEQLRGSGDITARLDPLSQSLEDLRHALADNDPRPVIGALEREVRTVGTQLQGLGVVDATAVSRLQTQTAEIRDLLSAATAQPVTLDKIERDLAALMRRMDEPRAPERAAAPAQTAEELRALFESTIQTPVQTIERRLDALAAKVDEAVGRTAARRRGDAIPGASDDETLEGMVGTLTSAIETARRPEAETDALGGLERQISRLAERLDRSEGEFANLSTLQASVGALFGHLEDTRKASLDIAEEAARKAVRDRPDAEAAGHVTREIADMRMLQDAADRRTNATLSAVHDTLEKMVERLGQMERGAPATLGEAAWSQPPRVGAPGRTDDVRRPAAAVSGDAAPSAALGRDDDFLIEPGLGFPGRENGGEQPGHPDTGRADFIAAARRAARAAQRDAEHVTAKRPITPGAGATAPHAALAQAKAFFASRKRAVVLSLAALFVVAGCYAVVRTASHSASTPKTVSALPMPKAPERVMANDTTASIPTIAAKPIVGSEPVVAGGMAAAAPTPASRLAAAGVEMPRILPTSTKLRDMAEAGNAAAQYETGNRYAEGRGLPRDPKVAAQWYEKAATQGFAPAQYRLGSLFEKGAGVPRDLTTAKMWYGKAVAAGNARAMHNLAVLTADGAGDKPDYPNAAILFRKAAELGIRDSQYNLAILLARGLGVSQNLVQSYMWFAVAAAQGDVDAGKKRDDVGARMSAADLAAAKTAGDTFQPRPLDQAANEAAAPAGGWDGSAPVAADRAVRPKVSTL